MTTNRTRQTVDASQRLHEEYSAVLHTVLFTKQPYVAAIYAGAVIDANLESLIDASVARGAEGITRGERGSTPRLVLLAQRLGVLYQATGKEILQLSKVRNEFAHRHDESLDFHNPDVRQWINGLSYDKSAVEFFRGAGPELQFFIVLGETWKGRWYLSVSRVVSELISRRAAARRVSKRLVKSLVEYWPDGIEEHFRRIAKSGGGVGH